MPSATDRPADNQPYVFVSYASADRERVLPVVAALERAGVAVWIDRDGIHGGENYALEITEAIEHAAALVLMCSAASLASRNVKQEIALAWKFERPYLPLLLEAVAIPKEVMYWLEAAQWIEVREKAEGAWLPAVLAALGPLGIIPPTVEYEGIHLAGREKELALLREKLAAAKEGKGGLVLIGGEAGVGKTTLAEAICREAERQGSIVLVGRCFDLAETPPYGSWIDLCARYPATSSLPALPPAFAERGTVGAVSGQMALFVQVQDFLTALTNHRPTELLLDDLHWADPASLDLLRFLTPALATLPLLILATYRSEELTRSHPLSRLLPQLARDSTVARLDLSRLSDDAVRALVTERYGLGENDTARLTAYVQGRAEGNALFVGELLRALEEASILQPADDAWRLGDLTTTAVPALLRQVIDGRVARLDGESQQLLGVAAVVGHEVPIDVWATVGEVDEDALLAVVEQGLEARLLVEVPGDAAVKFAHALIREALYEGIPGIRRRRMHRHVGEVLSAQRDPNPEAVAYHFRQAGDARAARWLVIAGTRARHAHAFVTAIERYETALALMERDDPLNGERGWVAYLLAVIYYYLAPAKGIATLTAVIDEATMTGDRTLAAIARFQRGLILTNTGESGALDDMVAALRVLDGQPPTEIERIRQHLDPRYSPDDDRAAVARSLAVVGRFAEATPLAERLVRDDQDPLGYPYANGAWVYGLRATALGEPTAARHWLGKAHAAFHAIGMHIPLLALIVSTIEALLAFAADEPSALAQLLEECKQIDTMVTEARVIPYFAVLSIPVRVLRGDWPTIEERARYLELDNVGSQSYFALGRSFAVVAWYQGDYEAARRHSESYLARGARTEPGIERFTHATAVQRVMVAVALETGDLPDAEAWLDAHDRWLAWAGAVVGQSEGQALWAQYHRQAGNMDKAREHAERALVHATEPRQPLALLAAHRLLGELDTDAGRFDDAETHLDRSLALADACVAPYERALTLLAMAELRAATGNNDEAKRLVDDVAATCESLGAKPALARAGALALRLTQA